MELELEDLDLSYLFIIYWLDDFMKFIKFIIFSFVIKMWFKLFVLVVLGYVRNS